MHVFHIFFSLESYSIVWGWFEPREWQRGGRPCGILRAGSNSCEKEVREHLDQYYCHNFLLLILNPKTHKENSLRHVAVVAKFVDLHKPWSCKYGRKKKKKNGSSYFSSIFRKCKWSSLSRKVVWDPEILLPWQLSSLLESKIAIK